MKPPLSLILLPTLKCNADCEYCFETKSDQHLSLDRFALLLGKVMDYLEYRRSQALSIYWQGGEIMTLPLAWFEHAHELIQEMAATRGKEVTNYLQSNMIGYSRRWNRIIAEMFGNSLGSSMDFPNLHRRVRGGTPQQYDDLWESHVREAQAAGIAVGVIAIPNASTLELGAEPFYAYFVDRLGIKDFQVNTPFPGGTANAVKAGYPLETAGLTRFLLELADIWMERGIGAGVRIGPFDKLAAYFDRGTKDHLLCIWRENCADEFLCIDPRGQVAQCDCWVSSYPGFQFGNLIDSTSLADLLHASAARRQFQIRPGWLIQRDDCLECDYLAICHGGCPVRAYSARGTLLSKDPYCELYKGLFLGMEDLVARHRSNTLAGLRNE